ncbi:RNA polymerase sigma factor [Dactylosporangium sp. McL0621]|uniref:RNA polymerase sigma factor n=1 Tax=Dactylosporangium sp. McL0621 TaxID=3415678 RepID=UPI003CE8A74A
MAGVEVPTVDDSSVIVSSLREPQQFAVLYERYAGDVHRYIYRRVGPDLADDLVAQTFLVAFARRHTYDASVHRARPWLFGIATWEISRHRRVESARYRALARAAPDQPVPEGIAERVADAVTARVAYPALAEALARLRAGDRDCLLLYAWGDLTYEEVAAGLRIPVGTVRSRLNRARRKLRDAFGGNDPMAIKEENE